MKRILLSRHPGRTLLLGKTLPLLLSSLGIRMSTPEFHEPSTLRDVAAFHRLFKAPVVANPAIPDVKRCALRVNLLQEELNELKAAIEQKDLVEVADAL